MGNAVSIIFAEHPVPPLLRPLPSSRIPKKDVLWTIRSSTLLFGFTIKNFRNYGLVVKVDNNNSNNKKNKTENSIETLVQKEKREGDGKEGYGGADIFTKEDDDQEEKEQRQQAPPKEEEDEDNDEEEPPFLAVINPVELTPGLLREVRDLEKDTGAKLQVIFSAGDWHHEWLYDWAVKFPEAKVYVVSQRVLKKQPNLKVIAQDRITVLDRKTPTIPELDQDFILKPYLGLGANPNAMGGDTFGDPRNEIAVYHKRSELLFLTDTIFPPNLSSRDSTLLANPVKLTPNDTGMIVLDKVSCYDSCQDIVNLNPKHLVFSHGFTTQESVFSLDDDTLTDKVTYGGVVPPVKVLLHNAYMEYLMNPDKKRQQQQDSCTSFLKALFALSYFLIGYYMLTASSAGTSKVTKCSSLPDMPLSVTTMAVVSRGNQLAFEDLIDRSNIVEMAKSTKGNIDYRVVRSINPDTTNQYQILEQWKSLESWKRWKNSDIPSSVFNTTGMMHILEYGMLSDPMPYVELTPATCRSQDTGMYTFVADNTCYGILEILSQTGNCFWIPGCDYSLYQTNRKYGAPKRAIYMKDGRVLRATRQDIDDLAFTYSIPSGGDELTGYVAALTMRDNTSNGQNRRTLPGSSSNAAATSSSSTSPSCTVNLQFSIPRTSQLTSDYMLDELKSKEQELERIFTGNNGKRRSRW